jgi:Protein kinase domain/AAA ATPase domain
MTVRRDDSVDIALVRQLGKGGNATVHEAIVGGRRVALKRPRRDALERRPEARSLFEREYYTLAQLAHPNIVEVYGYGIDAEGPYYTMELLDSESLSELAPLPWPQACRILRDVAAALAMVHSRRMVHRDVTMHNVRLTAKGKAKLMDFGAMTPIGIPEHTIGTPAYMAPEAVYHQALDQRTDLYALGALGYRLLCGRDAYPARRIDQLRDAWRSRPVPLSQRVPNLPPQLDELIRQLLSLNPAGRCKTAAEVFLRLGSVADLKDDETEIASAYLSAPTLVGRERELGTLRRHIVQSVRLKGSAVLVEGPAGVGRSRLLDACILDGQLMGALVLRARAVAGSAASFELIATLARQLVDARPILGGSDPRIEALVARARGENVAAVAATADEQNLLQHELMTWFMLATGERPLVLIVDDMHLADRESAAVLARLVDAAPKHRLTVVASALRGDPGICTQAMRLLRERATLLALQPLSEEQTLALVRSLFDDVVNVKLAAKRIFEIARGNPQATVDLAEWLVDGGHVTHEDGRWQIPDAFAALPLPVSVHDALRQRLSALGPHAIRLGAALAIAGEADLPSGGYGALLAEPDERLVHAALAELLAAQVLTPHGHGHGLAQAAYRELLVELVDGDVIASIHRRIAEVCLASDQPDWAIYHLFHGAARGEALDRLLARLEEGASPTQILHSLEGRVAWLREVLDACRQQGRPAAELFAVKNELVRRAEIKASLVRDEIAELSQHYKDLTGYNDWLALPEDMEPLSRIQAALRAAAERHDRLPAHDQIMGPEEALSGMLAFISSCVGSAAANTEIALLEQMPPLAPFAPLSESIRLLARYIEACEAAIGGQAETGSAKFIDTLRELEGEVGKRLGAGADRLRRHAMIAIGILNASLSRSIALDYADRLDALAEESHDPYARSTSLRIRHQYHLRRGNWAQAQYWEHEVELDKLTDRSALFHPSGVFVLAETYATLGSLAGMRECLAQMREYSAASEGLRIWHCYMAAEYDRLRGAPEQALPQHLSILETRAGTHVGWVYAAYGALSCLEGLGRLEEGKQLGDALLERARAAQLSAASGLILRPLSLIEARLGNLERAVALVQENIEQCRTLGMGGINLGAAYEYRARVAIWAQDKQAFETFTELCAEQYHAGGGCPDLTARFDVLLSDARRAGVVDAGWRSRELGPMTLSHAQVELRDRLADCLTSESRCQQALVAIARAANASGGYLYELSGDRFELLASSGCGAPPSGLLESAATYLETFAEKRSSRDSGREAANTESESTGSQSGAAERWRGETCAGFLPQVLVSPRDRARVGLFLLQQGAAPARAADRDLLEVVVETLLAAGDLRAPRRSSAPPPRASGAPTPAA